MSKEEKQIEEIMTVAQGALSNIATWLDKHAFREYLAAPRVPGVALAYNKWLSTQLRLMAGGKRDIPGPNG